MLASILPGYPAMNPLTAVGLLLACASVWPLAAGPRGKLARRIGQLFAAARGDGVVVAVPLDRIWADA